MSQVTNEMAINLPMVSVPPVTTSAVNAVDAEQVQDPSVVVGSPANGRDPACISVYAESITASGSYDPACEVCAFDVIFNVGIREGDTSKTYRVVKRIGIDKVKLACDAECSAPVSVVEHNDAAKKEAIATAKRFRILAGLE